MKKTWIIIFFLLTSCMPQAIATKQSVSSPTPDIETGSINTPIIQEIPASASSIQVDTLLELRHGGGILNARGTIEIESSTIEANRAGNGAGIYNELGILQVTDSVFVQNHASNELEPDYGLGAGIFNFGGQVTITGTLFRENQARFGSDIYYAYPGWGDTCEKIEAAFTTVTQSCFVTSVASSSEVSPSIGDAVFAGECNQPVIEATQNYWGMSVKPDESTPANVRVDPILEQAPSFCVQP